MQNKVTRGTGHGDPRGSDAEDFDLTLRIGVERLHIRTRIPQADMSIPEFLPVIQSLTDAVVAAAARGVARSRRRISCGPGCGACCRQLVPVAEAEAVHLAGVLAGLGADRRARVLERLRAARERLTGSGLATELHSAERGQSPMDRRELGLRYFRLGIPCPFLEDESCSIHPHRPLACREYLVTSDPRHCAHPEKGRVETVELPRRPSALLYRFGDGAGAAPARWMALPLALERAWGSGERGEGEAFPAPELFQRFVFRLAGADEDMG
jgi:Fe-S-cluster containining protein